MKLRLGQMLGQAVEGMPWLGTFHSIGGRSCAGTPSWCS
jgi:DNA helicase-2/ATP-dependent DNA helicase PcrA